MRAWVLVAVTAAGAAGLSGAQEIRQVGQDASLRIVVIAGEGSVNIVQQKTAVAPIVEVRDRNDLPVAGATVKADPVDPDLRLADELRWAAGRPDGTRAT